MRSLKPGSANTTVVPVFTDTSAPMQTLRQRCASAKPLGLVKTGDNELLVVFDGKSAFLSLNIGHGSPTQRSPDLGCYINRRGIPCRSSGYLRWETKAASYARRGPNILLFSSEFIEIRDIATGRLVQVIEGHDIRGVHASDHAIFVAMRGEDGAGGQEGAVVADRLVELFETADLRELKKQDSKSSAMWEEWDM